MVHSILNKNFVVIHGALHPTASENASYGHKAMAQHGGRHQHPWRGTTQVPRGSRDGEVIRVRVPIPVEADKDSQDWVMHSVA